MSLAWERPWKMPPPSPRSRSSPPRTRCAHFLDRLPDTATLEDIQYHLDVVIKVLEAEADTSGDISHAEAKRRFAQWFAK